MRTFVISAFVLIFLVGISSVGVSAVPQLPNISGWTSTGQGMDLNFKITYSGATYVAHVGYVEDFQNPNNPGELVRVFKRYIPFIERYQEPKSGELAVVQSLANFRSREKGGALSKCYENSDIVGYTQLNTAIDTRTGQVIPAKLIGSWLMLPSGEWAFSPNELIKYESLSELRMDEPGTSIQVGFLLYLNNNSQQALMIDQADFVQPLQEVKNAK